jgi:hypothetical protein
VYIQVFLEVREGGIKVLYPKCALKVIIVDSLKVMVSVIVVKSNWDLLKPFLSEYLTKGLETVILEILLIKVTIIK